MRSLTGLAFLGMLLLVAASLCSADSITYDVNLTVGAATVTGDIVTDGTIGVLTALSNGPVINWNLQLTDNHDLCAGSPCAVDLFGPYHFPGPGVPLEMLLGSGTDFTATATQLLFNFSGVDGGYFGFMNAVDVFCLESTNFCAGGGTGPGLEVSFGIGSVVQSTSLSGTWVIGTAGSNTSVPEPSTALLLVPAFVGLGGVRRKLAK
jgi:hypothetical protein